MDVRSIPFSCKEWYRMLVEEKTKCLSDFMASKSTSVFSDDPQIREKAVEDIVDVVDKLPTDFLHKDEATLLIEFFVRSLHYTALSGGAAIRGIHTVTMKSKILPDNFEPDLFKVLFKDGNLQSWPQNERKMQYDILYWLLKKRVDVLKAMGGNFLASFIKSVSGERDPRCLVMVFSSVIEVSKNFTLGPFTEDIFETIACYYPVQFKPQENDYISREFLAAKCASCLVSSPSFAPFCFMFLEEKLNDENSYGDEQQDIFNLLTLACEKFPSQSSFIYLDSILGGIRQVAWNPKRNGAIPDYVVQAFESLTKMYCASREPFRQVNQNALQLIVNSLIENSEPFILQAEMGICGNALTLLRCAFKCLPEQYSKIILNQTLAWILNLVHGDTVSAKQNKSDVMKEGLGYLIEWVDLAIERKPFSMESLVVFEQSIFASCTSARQIHPRSAVVTIYECASMYLTLECASTELVAQCHSWIASDLRNILNQVEFGSYLKMVTAFSKYHPVQVKHLLEDHPINTWNKRKVVPVLCAMSSSNDGWISFRDEIMIELKKSVIESEDDFNLVCYEAMMRRSDKSLLIKQFEAVESWLSEVCCSNPIYLSQFLQSIALLLPSEFHQNFTNEITSKYLSLKENELQRYDEKYRLVFLQSLNSKNLEAVATRKLSDSFVRQLIFASYNRNPQLEKLIRDDVAKLKANLLNGTSDSRFMFNQYLKNISSENTDSISKLNADFEFLLDFKSPCYNPERCRYNTGSSLWRQRLFCQIVPVFKEEFDQASENTLIIALLPHLLNFATTLDSQQLKTQFEMLLPVLIRCISSEQCILSHVTGSITLFLKVAGALSPNDLTLITLHLCLIIRKECATLADLEDALNSLHILVKRQSSKSLIPNLAAVVHSVNKILGHKKRCLRKLAADVKNSWEMLENK